MRSDVQLVPGPPPPRIQKAESGYRYFPLPVVCILSSDGAVAQLGERELCKLEVVGSIPIGSTNRYPEDRDQKQATEIGNAKNWDSGGYQSDACFLSSVL